MFACSNSANVVMPPSLRIDEIRGPMPLIWVRSSGGAALADAVRAAAGLAFPAIAFSLCFIRPAQSPLTANEACIGHVADVRRRGGVRRR